MYFNKCKLLVSLAMCLNAYSVCFAQQPTHSKEEMNRFNQFRSGYPPETTEQYWERILGLEQLLADYPNTFLKGDISITLLNYYQHVTDDPHLLIELSDKMLALRMYSNGAYETAARILVDKKVRSDKTLLYAQNALKEALQKQKKWGGNGRGELICRDLLARAHQLLGQHDRAVAEIKTAIRSWQTREDLGDLEMASRQASVDKAKTHLLRIYIDQKAWTEAYELASELLLSSIIRTDIAELWSQAYAGKFGSGAGMSKAYVALKAKWDKKIIQRVEKKRISRPAPTFEVQKLDGEKITSEDLKGKAMVLTFWAGWCSPCIEEQPYLQNLKTQFRKQNVEFLAINIDQDSSMRRDMVASFRYQSAPLLTFALGDLQMRKAFGSDEIPYTCIIDQNGQIRYERKGLGADFSVAMAHQLEWVIGMNGTQ
ncbi:MAG: TlpA family protein disulfide reductase [Gemmatimonadetes bacterium]|nr:TlpA family protein disulfide reductase [Gemmatimonadota bacterium]MYK53215.1 TlpA family protein disulfide reductase [Gemmatimonadota bacterium]